VVKDTPPGELLDAVRRAAEGDSPFSQTVLSRLVDQAVRARGAAREAPAATRRSPTGFTSVSPP
jgi:hypothetical protein